MCLRTKHTFFYVPLTSILNLSYDVRKRTYRRNKVQAQICVSVVNNKIFDDRSFIYAKNYNNYTAQHDFCKLKLEK